jgi:hypothetical protein
MMPVVNKPHAESSRAERNQRISRIANNAQHHPIDQDDARFLLDEIGRLGRFERAVWQWSESQRRYVTAEQELGVALRDHYNGAEGA